MEGNAKTVMVEMTEEAADHIATNWSELPHEFDHPDLALIPGACRKAQKDETAKAVNAFLRNSKLSIMDSNFGGSVMAWHVYHDDAEGEYESTAATPLEAILDWYEDTK